jgi:hypothetical protein
MEAYARVGELSASTRDVMHATRLRNTFMLRDGEEMPLARPERSLRGKSPRFFFFLARHFQRCSPFIKRRGTEDWGCCRSPVQTARAMCHPGRSYAVCLSRSSAGSATVRAWQLSWHLSL